MLPVDFFQIESLLTDEERLIQENAARFVDQRILPIIRDCFENGEFPKSLVREMGEQGFLGVGLERTDGEGLGPVGYGLTMQELERGDSGIRSFASVQNSLVIDLIDEAGSPELKERLLPGLSSGAMIGCFGLTEPDQGSDPGRLKTRAEPVDDGYVLNGTKTWITNAEVSDVAVVWAWLDDVIRAFVVDAGTPGMTLNPIHHKFSMRASATGEIFLNDCRIPKKNLLEGTNGLRSALNCLTRARYGIAWGVLGAATACYREAVQHAKTRVMFGKPIGGFQLVQEKLADMLTGITCGQLLCLRLGRLMEKGKADYTQVSMAKRNNVRIALNIARSARDILGASGISVEYSTIRHMLNLESVITYEGTDSIHTLILGKKITGLDAVRG